MPRGARLDAPGTLHHVIVRGVEGRKIVDDNKDRQSFVSRMCWKKEGGSHLKNLCVVCSERF